MAIERIFLVTGLWLWPASGALPAAAMEALQVLRQSLSAPGVPYEGEVTVVTRESKGVSVRNLLVRFAPPARYRREIVDQSGIPLVTIVSNGTSEWVYDHRRAAVWSGEPADADYKLVDPDQEFDLLVRNYEFQPAGEEKVAGRECQILEVRSRENGELTRRLWVDRAYGLVLQRKTYREGRESSATHFLRVTIPSKPRKGDFSFSPPPGVRVLSNCLKPDYMGLEEAASTTDMRPRPPSWLPPGYMFESVNLLPYKGATVLHYRYWDGIHVLSLFQCPRRVRLRLGGPATSHAGKSEHVRLQAGTGRLALVEDGKVLEWSSGDRFVLVGELGVEELRRVADSIPKK